MLEKEEPTLNAYYTPDIEDFRVGYEFEFQGIPKGWHKMIFSEENSLKIMKYNIEKLEDAIRVPYLTKEQIEAEGWKIIGSQAFADHLPIYEKDNYRLLIYDDNFIRILINDPYKEVNLKGDRIHPYKLYQGECKSINELRYISKLLCI